MEIRRWIRYDVEEKLGECPACKGTTLVAVIVTEGDDAHGEYGSYVAVAFCPNCTGPYKILELTALGLGVSLDYALDWLLAKKVLPRELEKELWYHVKRLTKKLGSRYIL